MSRAALSRDQLRDIDRRAIDEFGIPGILLMENAGAAAAQWLIELENAGPIVICCGKGNNGGDGYVMARHLDGAGHTVHVLLACDPAELSGDALTNFRIVERCGIPYTFWNPVAHDPDIAAMISHAAWIVDGLLGTGTRGSVREPLVAAIDQINNSGARKLAIDIPSGLDCDTGQSLGTAVRAQFTASFVAAKLGFHVAGASQFTGTIRVFDIGIPRRLMQEYAGAGSSQPQRRRTP